MKIHFMLLTLIFFLVLSGCQNTNSVKQSSDKLVSTNWTFLGMQHNDNKVYEPIPTELARMNIVFSNAHTFQANSSCNIVYGYYLILKQNSLKMDSIVMTKMFCMDSVQIVWEDRYISGLRSSESFKITGDTLAINTNSNIDMIFKTESKKSGTTNKN
jgi:heat shock protein HslJ